MPPITYPMKRERSMNKVINSLQKGSKRFKDLEKDTKLSPAGLNDTLKMMKKENMVELILVEDEQRYRLTKKGETIIEKYLYLSYDIDVIRARFGNHYRDYSRLWNTILATGFHWGIESDLTLDKDIKNLNLLQPKDVMEIEEIIFKKIKYNIRERKSDIKYGKMVLGFSIDYNELVKSIQEKSLAYVNHMSKEEVKILEKFDGSPDSLTEQDNKRLEILRKKTYEKIKNMAKD